LTSTTRLWARARHRTFKPLYAGLSPEQQQMRGSRKYGGDRERKLSNQH
jgi:hypothetical protein